MKNDDFLRMPVWYPILAEHAFVTSFVKLRPEAVGALAAGAGADGALSGEWEKTVRAMIGSGADTFVELGPGNTLCGLIRKTDPSVRTFCASSAADIDIICREAAAC